MIIFNYMSLMADGSGGLWYGANFLQCFGVRRGRTMFQQGSMQAYWPTATAQANKAQGGEGGITLGAFLLMAAMANSPQSSLQVRLRPVLLADKHMEFHTCLVVYRRYRRLI